MYQTGLLIVGVKSPNCYEIIKLTTIVIGVIACFEQLTRAFPIIRIPRGDGVILPVSEAEKSEGNQCSPDRNP